MSDAVDEQTPSSDNEDVGRFQAIADYSKNRMRVASVDISARVRDFDAKKAVGAVLDAPKRLKREWQKSGATGVITRFPIATVALFLMITLYFVTTSGFLDDTQFDDDPNEPALNVNGDMEVYLPDGSEVKELIGLVEEDWTTNVMVIYIESEKNNITDQRILQEISYVEKNINPYVSDNESDDVIYILSISTVLKEVNSSLPRIRDAFITELGRQCPTLQEVCENLAASVNAGLSLGDDQFAGGYEIPSQATIDLIVNEMYEDDGSPTPGLDKLARNTNPCSGQEVWMELTRTGVSEVKIYCLTVRLWRLLLLIPSKRRTSSRPHKNDSTISLSRSDLASSNRTVNLMGLNSVTGMILV